MLIRITSVFCLVLGCCFSTNLCAQRTTVTVEPIDHFDPYFEDLAKEIENFVTRHLTENKALRVVERTDFSAITEEQERQKNEGFIDGEVVEQGKLVGARLIVRFTYDEDQESLRLQTVDMAEGTILCSETFSTSVGGSGKMPQVTKDKMTVTLQSCFQQYTAPAAPPLIVVELLEKISSQDRLLVYADDTKNLNAGTQLSVFTRTTKKVGNKEIDYEEVVGVLIVEEVENKNFLNGKVTEGSDAIRKLLMAKTEIYAKAVQ